MELQSDAGNYAEVVDQVFSLFPDKEHYSDTGSDRCRTCAVVGNSGNLLGSNYGPLIDFHDFVIRTYVQVPSTIKADKDKVMILHPEFIRYVYDNWAERHGRYPSTGFLTLIFALHICDETEKIVTGLVNDTIPTFHFCSTAPTVYYVQTSPGGGRINKGPTEGYEKDVGSKRTHRILYPESTIDFDNSTHLVLLPVKILDIQWLISAFTTKNITRSSDPWNPVHSSPPDATTHHHGLLISGLCHALLLPHLTATSWIT
ncbi:hypothetical protein cypCar_00026912, partial [Cyprinus carpio]